jgi:hypothetical protein
MSGIIYEAYLGDDIFLDVPFTESKPLIAALLVSGAWTPQR